MDAKILDALIAIVGSDNVIVDPDRRDTYGHDEFSLAEIQHRPDVVVRPRTTEETAGVLRLANEHGIPVTARGGATVPRPSARHPCMPRLPT